jgi:hypothetical protein
VFLHLTYIQNFVGCQYKDAVGSSGFVFIQSIMKPSPRRKEEGRKERKIERSKDGWTGRYVGR